MRKHILCRLLLFGVAVSILSVSLPCAKAQGVGLADLANAIDSTSASVLAAQEDVARARSALAQSHAFPNPTLFGLSEELGNANQSVTENTIGVRQDIGFLWSYAPRRSSASAALEAAEAALALERSKTYSDIILKLLRFQQIVENQQLLDTMQGRFHQILQANEARVIEGDISGFDAQRVRFEALSVTNRRSALVSEQQLLLSALGRATGLCEYELSQIDLDGLSVLPYSNIEDATEYAREHAPELALLHAKENAAKHSVTAAKRNRWPALALGAGSKSTNRDDEGFLVEAELELPLFGRRNADVQLATAQAFQSSRLSRVRSSSIDSEISGAFSVWKELSTQPQVALELESLLSHMKTAHSLYMSGEIGYLEFLDAFSVTEVTLNERFEIDFARLQADLRLRELTGYPTLETK
ncbi:TolC family protein [candidate division KSB1 bacterium]|nr:TolC family protein [candidate division KSB1 bacterium]